MDGKRPLNMGKPHRNESNFTPGNTDTNRLTPPPDATLMAHFSAAAAAIGQLDHSYDNLFPQLSHPGSSIHPFYDLMPQNAIPPHHTTTPTATFPWDTPIPQQSLQQPPQVGPSQYHPMMDIAFRSPPTQGSSDAIGHPPIPPEVESEVAEEKRHRNTVASARFRVKKKHKTIALERSVTDLTGRAEELEREASDLRRENGWLKEIVMLKGAQFAANNRTHQEALRQAASLVTSGQIAFAPATVGGSKGQSEKQSEEESEDVEADDGKNVKGKKPRTGKNA